MEYHDLKVDNTRSKNNPSNKSRLEKIIVAVLIRIDRFIVHNIWNVFERKIT